MGFNKSILYLTYDGLTDPLGQSQILPYLIGLEKKGCEFTIVSFEKENQWDSNARKIKESISDKNIDWIPLRYTKSPPVISTLYDLWRMHSRIKKILKSKKVDIIHSRSYLPMLLALKFKKKCKILFDMRGFWADERVEGKLWPQSSILYRIIYSYFLKKEFSFLESCDAVVSLSHAGVLALEKRYPNIGIGHKCTVIPCCVDTILFSPNIVYSNRETFHIPKDAVVLTHVGSMGTWYRFDKELDFFALKKQELSKLFFLIVTKDIQKAKDIIQSKGLDLDSFLLISVDYKDVPFYLSLSDFALFFIEPSFSKQASFPVKMAEAMSMGIPVITNKGIGDVSEIILESKSGWALDNLEIDGFKSISLLSNGFSCDEIRDYTVSHFDVEVGVKKYNEIYNSLKPTL